MTANGAKKGALTARYAAAGTLAATTLGLLYLSSKLDSFLLHPALMAAALWLCSEALVQVKVATPAQKKGVYRTHWALQTVSFAAFLGGVYVIFTLKEEWGESHFDTTHGQAGLAFIVLTEIQWVLGLSYLCMPRFIATYAIKLHRFVGVLALTSIYASFLTGVYDHMDNVPLQIVLSVLGSAAYLGLVVPL